MSSETSPLHFEKEYWETNYSDPFSMDCIGNAREHAAYLKYFFALDLISINSVIDFGVGLGYLFREILRKFMPERAFAIDPSIYALERAKSRLIPIVSTMKIEVHNIDLSTWAKDMSKRGAVFDLGLCTSVFQYLSEEDLRFIIPVMARKVRYLYLTVPTDKEIKRMKNEVDFVDPYSLARSREFYLKLLRPHFTVVGRRILESKVHFSDRDTLCSELLFRF
ncbi:MAG: class I SAM-dependent methyltransferase [Bdellovibrio sp.]|nr:class I SAM-dependent methyltransferase [Bdellovibrio sp.]